MSTKIAEIFDEIVNLQGRDPAYWVKMMHRVPPAVVVDRELYIESLCRGRVVLSVGSTGGLQVKIDRVAKKAYGIDKVWCAMEHFYQVDLDADEYELVPIPDLQLIVCGEVLEHLANPGRFLKKLKQYECGMVITVPNAFSEAGFSSLRHGYENVNKDHVAYYSYKTLLTLVQRYGYELKEWFWYKGKPYFAEGLIFLVR